MCVCEYGHWKSASRGFINLLPPNFLRKHHSVNLELTDSARLVGHQVLGSKFGVRGPN